MLAALPLVLSLFTAVPDNADRWQGEDPSKSPLEVCDAVVQAARDSDYDGVVGRSTAATRKKFNDRKKAAIRTLHSAFLGTKCQRVESIDKKAKPPVALVWVYIPGGRSRLVPFTKENGVWRLDEERYEKLRKGDPLD